MKKQEKEKEKEKEKNFAKKLKSLSCGKYTHSKNIPMVCYVQKDPEGICTL